MLKIFKNRYFWIGVGFLLLVALSLLVGAWLDWSLVTRLLVVIGLLVVGLGFVTVEFVRASRNAQKIEQSITMQAEEQRQGARPDKQAEIDELESRLEEAIATLKDSKLGRGRHSQNALHALPWYMFVGPPGAGKTTAIKNSGLNFPMGADGVRGVGGTRNCDWFFSDQAILLDTAGRYMTEKEDEEEWHAFLDMLKDRRKHRPINGVIVGISLEELVDASPEKIEWHADNIRRRISELVERLEVQFPVYLVFTKCDLLQGFVEFFEDTPRSGREQIWGATLTDEQREEASPRTLFDEEFDLLYDSLVSERVDRLKRVANPETRRRVYVFPLEFAAAKENLSLFVDQLFQDNPYQENPDFRGFYFTSGTQEGAPIDRVLESMSEEADLSSEVHSESEPETKSYFIKNLFTEAIVPDQYRVRQTSRSVQRERLMRWGVGAVSALLLGVFVLFAGQAVVRSEVSLAHVEDVAQQAASIEWGHQPGVQNLETIDQLRSTLVRLERYEEDPPLLRWGFYRSGVVLDPARDLFVRKMRPVVRTQYQGIEETLRQVTDTSGTLGQEQRLQMRETLRAYLLLSEESARLDDKQERVFLKRYLTSVATRDSGQVASSAQLKQRSGQVESQIARYVTQLDQGRAASFQAESALIRDVRRVIYRKPTIGNLYAEIKQKGSNSLRPLRLSSIVQQSGGATLFSTTPEVSGFFTKQGWNGYVQERIEKVAQNPGEGDWVLGNQSSQLSDELKQEDKIIEQLRERYFRDYATAWTDFLRRVQYRSFDRVGGTARALNTLGDPLNSPVLHLLARVTTETRFASSMAKKAKGQVKEEVKTRAQAKIRQRTRSSGTLTQPSGEEETTIHPVTREFTGLHQLKADKAANGEASSELTRTLRALGRVGRTLDDLAGSPGKATDVAVRVLNGESELQSALTTIRNGLPRLDAQVRRQLFEKPLLNAWSTILWTAQEQLNRQWRRDVYRPYQKNLKGRYPFDPSSEDASLADVERFFGPQKGIVASFKQKELRPFLREGRLEPKTWEGRGLRLSPSTRAFLDAVDRIGQTLMGSGALRLRFKLIPEIPKKEGDAPAPSQVFIRAHGTSQTYEMGYQPKTLFTWPGARGARLVLDTRGATFTPKRKEGAWAWFRLLEEASVEPRSPDVYRVRWRFAKENRYAIITRYNLQSGKHQRLFTNPAGFFRLSVPEQL